jgi:integrase
VTFRGGAREADRELTRLAAKYEGALPVAEAPVLWTDTTTVNDAITAWKQNGWQDLSPTTVRHYQELWDKHIKSSIGRREIAQLNPYEVERYFRRLKDEGTGRTTVKHIRAMLNRACRLARKWSANTLPNPVVDTELPVWPLGERGERGEPVRAPDLAEVRAILTATAAHDERFGAFVRLVAATGVRRGEACALRWSDIDWESGTVLIDESVVAASGGAEVKAPKTKASIRRLALDPGTLEVLRAIRVSQESLAALVGDLQAAGDTVQNDPNSLCAHALAYSSYELPNTVAFLEAHLFVAPTITSRASKTIRIGTPSTATVKAEGNRTPGLSDSGAVPGGITFVDQGNGTGALVGTAVAGSAGSYPIAITATNGGQPTAVKQFTLVVKDPKG